MDICDHLRPILHFIETNHGLTVAQRVNGRGWGLGILVTGKLPFAQIQRSIDIPVCVTLSADNQMISCSECWTNIAEHSVYKNNWG